MLCLGQLAELSGPELVSRLLGAVYVGCQACTKPLRIVREITEGRAVSCMVDPKVYMFPIMLFLKGNVAVNIT